MNEISPDILKAKQRYSIIGNASSLVNAVGRAIQVAPIDLSVLIIGESGSGKEFFPNIIHDYSARKHNRYIAVNCGAIPEGTIDSELFGHEKGAFTGAISSRKGYFEEADGGTIFLDEVAELPLTTQARLLRVLESGEYIKIYRGMQSLSQFSSAVFKMVDTIKDAKEKFQYRIEDNADDYTIKDLQKYYKMQLGLPLDKEFNKDAFILKMRGDAGLEEVVEIKPSMYDRDFIDNFIDEEVDYITERIEKVRKNANDTAAKMIKEIEAQENYKQRDILNLKTYVAAMTHLFGAYQYVRTILLKSHATICNTLDRIKK
jgi:hypothetical protein